MCKYTAKQRVLSYSQEYEPIFMYTNPITKEVNFGLVRLKSCCLYITLALRPLLKQGRVHKTGELINFDLKSYNLVDCVGDIIKIDKENE